MPATELSVQLLVGLGQAAAVLALAPLLEGVIRKLRAVIHSRKGPPIIQPYLDLAKLLGKEELRVNRSWPLRAGPILLLSSLLIAAAIAPVFSAWSPAGSGDIIVFAYMLTLAAASLVMIGFASGSPFSTVGASREIMLLMATEPIIIFCLLGPALKAGSFSFSAIISNNLQEPSLSMVVAGVAFLGALQLLVAKIPFDITEAEQEIMGGPLTELSGPPLALCLAGLYVKQLLYWGLFVQVFVPWLAHGLTGLIGPIVVLAVVLVLNLLFVGLTQVLHPRLRIDQALLYAVGVEILALMAVAYAAIGT